MEVYRENKEDTLKWTQDREEVERERRIAENQAFPKTNARRTADMIKTMPSTLQLRKGTPTHVRTWDDMVHDIRRSIEVEDIRRRIRANTENGKIRMLEEEEMLRRSGDTEEAIARRMVAAKAAGAIQQHIGGNVITQWKQGVAKSLVELKREVLHQIDLLRKADITFEDAVYFSCSFFMNCFVWFLVAVRKISESLIPVAEAAAVYAPYFAVFSLSMLAKSVRRISKRTKRYIFPLTVADIKHLEELERKRRIGDDVKDGVARANGRRVATLIKNTHFPFNKFGVKHGFLRHTTILEEKERLRRLGQKADMLHQQSVAQRVADMVMQQGAASRKCAVFKRTRSLEEKERLRRIEDHHAQVNSQWLARNTSALVRQLFLPFGDSAFTKTYIASLEEGEREQRMKNPDQAVHNAHRVASIFADSKHFQGAPTTASSNMFAKKGGSLPTSNAKVSAKRMARRLSVTELEANDKHEAKPWKSVRDIKRSQEQASNINDIINKDVYLLQENEREFRMADKLWQQQAVSNAQKVAKLIKSRSEHPRTPTPTRHLSRENLRDLAPNKQEAKSPRDHLSSSHGFLEIPKHLPVPQDDLANVVPISPRNVGATPPNTPRTQRDEHAHEANKSVAKQPVAVAEHDTKAKLVKANATFAQNKRITDIATLPADDEQKLIESVRKLYDYEMKCAEKEAQKADSLRDKKGLFLSYRRQQHETAAEAHRKSAARHDQFLRAKQASQAH